MENYKDINRNRINTPQIKCLFAYFYMENSTLKQNADWTRRINEYAG